LYSQQGQRDELMPEMEKINSGLLPSPRKPARL